MSTDDLRKLATLVRMGELSDPAAVIMTAAARIEKLEAERDVWRTRAYELMATKRAVYDAVTARNAAWEVTP